MSNEAWNPNYIAVYPQGQQQECHGDPDAYSSGIDDVSFVLELIKNLEASYCIDPARLYASGHSNGGGLSANILACDPVASTVFAGFMASSGAEYQPGTTEAGCDSYSVSTATCNPGRWPVPLFTTHGDGDGTISYYGGPRRGMCLPAQPHFQTDWAVRNGLTSTNISTSLYCGAATQYTYGNSSSGFQGIQVHYKVSGWGHHWPSVASGAPFDATPLMLILLNTWTLDSTNSSVRDTPVATTSSATATGTNAPNVGDYIVNTKVLRAASRTMVVLRFRFDCFVAFYVRRFTSPYITRVLFSKKYGDHSTRREDPCRDRSWSRGPSYLARPRIAYLARQP